jgi:signal transduction histidine kinase
MRRRLKGLTERDWRTLDRLLVVVVIAGAWIDVSLTTLRDGPVVANGLVMTAVALTLLWRRERPLFTVAGFVVGMIAMQAFLTEPPNLTTVPVMLVIISYSVAVHLDRRDAFIGLAAMVGLVGPIAAVTDPKDIAFPVGMFVVVPWLVGRTLRNHTMLARELAEKGERAEHAREEQERRAVAAERSRVARELHDVLAHNLSVMVIQASAARRVVERDPDAALESAALIRRTGREALAELRQLFGPVRRDEGVSLPGSPGLANVERLAAGARAAGLTVQLRVEGTAPKLPPGVDMTAYRVVQEALTNTLKYGGGAKATVSVYYEPGDVVVEVLDDGPGPGGNGSSVDGGGHGLVGMRERVALYGGKLDCGRRRGGGFAVRARLPVGGALA